MKTPGLFDKSGKPVRRIVTEDGTETDAPKILIVGGVAGGATAAARLRRLNEYAEIIVFERTGYVSYANCGLPYYVGGVIGNKRALTLQSPAGFAARYNVEVRVGTEVISVDPAAHTVKARELATGREYTEDYDRLLLAPGARAVLPDIPGIHGKHVHTLRTVEDTLRLAEHASRTGVKRAVVVGGGFIGLEAAENFIHRNIDVTLLQRGRQVLPPLDEDMAVMLAEELVGNGVDVRFGAHVTEIRGSASGAEVITQAGSYPADIVLLSTGVMPESDLALACGIETGIKGAIVTDEFMNTSDPDIFAVGDVAQTDDLVTESAVNVPLAGPANRQARIAADNICGRPDRYRGTQGTSVIKLFGLTAASTGLNEKTAKKAGVRYLKTITLSPSHATYYPGAEEMFIKLLFTPDAGKLLGAQIVGRAGVDKRIDVLAVALRAGMSVYDLTALELAYAPPFSSAKDPVNVAGYVAENVLDGMVKQLHAEDLPELCERSDIVMLDVRTRGEFATGHFSRAVNIPVDELRQKLDYIPRGVPVYVNCRSGTRSYIACRVLTAHGFECYNLAGGAAFAAHVHPELFVR